MKNNIIIIGAQRTGKSTLAMKLAKDFEAKEIGFYVTAKYMCKNVSVNTDVLIADEVFDLMQVKNLLRSSNKFRCDQKGKEPFIIKPKHVIITIKLNKHTKLINFDRLKEHTTVLFMNNDYTFYEL